MVAGKGIRMSNSKTIVGWACFKKHYKDIRQALKDGRTVYVEPSRQVARDHNCGNEKYVKVYIVEAK